MPAGLVQVSEEVLQLAGVHSHPSPPPLQDAWSAKHFLNSTAWEGGAIQTTEGTVWHFPEIVFDLHSEKIKHSLSCALRETYKP